MLDNPPFEIITTLEDETNSSAAQGSHNSCQSTPAYDTGLKQALDKNDARDA